MQKAIGYLRVSTREQGRSGLGLAARWYLRVASRLVEDAECGHLESSRLRAHLAQ